MLRPRSNTAIAVEVTCTCASFLLVSTSAAPQFACVPRVACDVGLVESQKLPPKLVDAHEAADGGAGGENPA